MDTMSRSLYRVFFLGVTLGTVSANLMLDYNWPVPDPNIYRFPHESSCHFYYLRLSDEDISVEKCPDGQLFDYVKHECLPAREHIHCWSRRFGKIRHDHTLIKHKKHFKCPYPWGKYPNLHDCTKYHLCLHGKSMAKKCAPFEMFDKISRKCIASIDAVCADKTDVVEHGYVCPKTWGSFTYSKDCSKYYECLQRKPTLRTCQKGKLFDDRLRTCAQKEHVYCGLRHNPYENVISNDPETPSDLSSSSADKLVTLSTITAVKKTVSTEAELTLLENSSTPKEAASTAAASNKPVSPSPGPETDSSETKQKGNILVEKPTAEAASTAVATDKPVSPGPETDNSETKQKGNVLVNKSAAEAKVDEQQKTGKEVIAGKKAAVGISSTTEKEQAMTSSEILADDESEAFKKDVSTEEKDESHLPTSQATATEQKEPVTDTSATTVTKNACLPEDSSCITEKDGTVVKCSSFKGLQPHPKDERRFLDCTGTKIQIHNCPLNLTFNPELKKCKWQFVMAPK